MARSWLWQTGWEAGFPRRIGSGGFPWLANPNRDLIGQEQDLWDCIGVASGAIVADGTARTGKFHTRQMPAGLGAASLFTGQWATRTNDWVFWHTAFRHMGWQQPLNITGGDDYLYARCTNIPVGVGPDYLGIGFRCLNLAPVTRFQVVVHHYNGVAFMVTPGVLVGMPIFSPPTPWIVATVAHQIAAPRATYLYVNGGAPIGPWNAPVPIYNDAPMLLDNVFAGGKGADAFSELDFDDWGAAEGSVQGDVPLGSGTGAGHGVLLAQPNADVAGINQWTPHGFQSHYHNWDPENQNPECWGCHYNDPTAIGQQEACDFAPLALGVEPPALVEAARFVWAQSGAAHAVRGRIAAAAWSGALASGRSFDNTNWFPGRAIPHCFDSPAYWHGAQMQFMPGIGGAWTMANFNLLQGRLDAAVAAGAGGVEDFYAMAMTGNVTPRTMPTPNACPIAALQQARQRSGEQPYLVKPEMVPYHHH